MRGIPSEFTVRSPRTLAEALDLLDDETLKPIAGGTDLMVIFEAGKLSDKKLLDISKLKELKTIEITPQFIKIGSLVTYSEIQENPILRKEFPMLVEAARLTGALAIQNRGTLGGNIANASPAADSPPALLAYNATLEIISSESVREVSYGSFHKGYKKTDLKSSELIKSICLPRVKRQPFQIYRKVGTRRAQAISKVCFAGAIFIEKGRVKSIRLSIGSVAPMPIRCLHAENILEGARLEPSAIEKAVLALKSDIAPISDARSTDRYRQRVAENLLKEFLTKAGALRR